MANIDQGNKAESAVTNLLKQQKYEILGRNWKTPVCEIDIIAKQKRVIYFVEVKYRANNQQGEGFDYITSNKLKQMEFAGKVWIKDCNWEGDWQLMAAEVTGDDYSKITIIEC
jgi:putative endonuclease